MSDPTVLSGVVSAGIGVTALALSAALQVLSGRGMAMSGGGRLGGMARKLELPRVHIALWTTGGIGLIGTGLGHLLNSVITWANTSVGHMASPYIGVGAGWLVSLGASVVLLVDLREDQCSARTMALAAASPFLFSAIPGPTGHAMTGAITWVAHLLAGVIGTMFGLH